jgi:Cu/Ag efflux protein CusF
MKKAVAITITAVAILLVSSAGYAEKRAHEGKIVSIDPTAMTMVVQGEKGDQWNLYWTETTKLKNGLTFGELKSGDKIHFDYLEKDGRMWVTELRRTGKADRD